MENLWIVTLHQCGRDNDYLIANNAWAVDAPGQFTQVKQSQGHIVFAQNTWVGQDVLLDGDWDAYSLIANNLFCDTINGAASAVTFGNHYVAGVDGADSRATYSGTPRTLFADATGGNFSPRGLDPRSFAEPILT
ncbi:hypothetical protein D2V07_17115 [Aurantiacibacter zhengii]|uniref:Uncharacterized protein n=2 Tax=Aurantiacibacter zhengii TaxID=2307003 RepID=A0A418NN78_9SPHN|nr:hypothetical protein D2V07_17115 [Aurantiacibacter zhengii]